VPVLLVSSHLYLPFDASRARDGPPVRRFSSLHRTRTDRLCPIWQCVSWDSKTLKCDKSRTPPRSPAQPRLAARPREWAWAAVEGFLAEAAAWGGHKKLISMSS
jgi:hypothetical protein